MRQDPCIRNYVGDKVGRKVILLAALSARVPVYKGACLQGCLFTRLLQGPQSLRRWFCCGERFGDRRFQPMVERDAENGLPPLHILCVEIRDALTASPHLLHG